jgi:hypothetical protein
MLLAVVTLPACTATVTTSVTVTQSSTGQRTVTVGVAVTISKLHSNLAGFDPTQALVNMSTSNATITSSSGTFTVTVSDASSGQVYGQQAFGYVVSGNSLYAQDPTALYNWLTQFSGYSCLDVTENLNDLQGRDTVSSGTASATASAVYQGTTYGSSTATWEIPPCKPCQN